MVALMAQQAIDRNQAMRNQLAASRDIEVQKIQARLFEITSLIAQHDIESAQMTQGSEDESEGC
jgi:hypothetical protein